MATNAEQRPKPPSWRQVELHPARVGAALFLLGCLVFVVVNLALGYLDAASMGIVAAGFLAAALIYDLGTARGQRRNFIEDAEARGAHDYAAELKASKW